MCANVDSMPGADAESKKAALVSRRCIALALVGSTPSSNSSLSTILQDGYLGTVKQWMDDTLSGAVGEFLDTAIFFLLVLPPRNETHKITPISMFSGSTDLLLRSIFL